MVVQRSEAAVALCNRGRVCVCAPGECGVNKQQAHSNDCALLNNSLAVNDHRSGVSNPCGSDNISSGSKYDDYHHIN